MASIHKRSLKLQELVGAHNANVNCLRLGRKSGRVMVTGGDDRKVNVWAIGKHSCFMSLSAHTTPVDCVQFNQVEELVCAGARSGALKIWDLEAARLTRTLTNHKDTITSIDFHPYGDVLASGSADCTIKLWDCRKKGCIYSYPGHKIRVNCVKFSPDGHWIASSSDDCIVKIWDMRIGKVLKEFDNHTNPVTSVEFHPHEFLLASAGTDGVVNFFDLENFNLVSTEENLGAVRSLWFNPNGECLFAGVRDYLKVIGWEPSRMYDSVCVNWGRICDISTAQNQLIGASYHLTNVMVYMVDLDSVQPFGGPVVADSPSPFTPNQNIRKSFSKAERPTGLRQQRSSTLDVKTIEESTSGTDPEEESSAADITNLTDYEEIFKGRGLRRTPPLTPEEDEDVIPLYFEPQKLNDIGSESCEALSLDHNVNYNHQSPPQIITATTYGRSKSNLDTVFASRVEKRESVPQPQHQAQVVSKAQQAGGGGGGSPPQNHQLRRQSSCKENTNKSTTTNRPNNIRHCVSEVNLNRNANANATNKLKSRKSAFTKNPVKAITKIPMTSRNNDRQVARPNNFAHTPVDIYVSNKSSPEEGTTLEEQFIPASLDRPVGLQMDDFLPKTHETYGYQRQLTEMSELEVLGIVTKGHEPMLSVMITRQRNLKIVRTHFKSKDTKAAFEVAVTKNDPAIIVDLLGIFNSKYSVWNLDVCVLMLPKIEELLQSKFELYITTGSNALKLILRHFGHIIKTNMQCPAGSFGVDISREERYQKSLNCHSTLENIRLLLLKKSSISGSIGKSFSDLLNLLESTMD